MILTNPLVYFDTESSGTDTNKDRIVQIAAIKIHPNGKTEEKNYLINPEIPIPEEASEIHGITNEMVKDAPTFKQLAVGIRDWFAGCDIGGFNSDSFDVLLLLAEMNRAGVEFSTEGVNFVDVRKVFQKLYPNTLSDIYYRFFGKELEGAHNALMDVIATKEILEYMLAQHPELELNSPQDIDDFCQGTKRRVDMAGKMYEDEEGTIRWNFSKNKDKPVKEDKGFAQWVLNQDFPRETKDKLKITINGK